jgi:outer membrane protein TolC
VSWEKKKYQAELVNFRRGRSTTDVIVRFQRDVQLAESQALRADLELFLATAELARATGILEKLLDQAP